MSKIRELALEVALLLCGACIGTLIAWPVARMIQLKLGQDQLLHYGDRMLSVAESNANEVFAAAKVVTNDKLPFCSDEELALMRQFVYNASHVKDIGRTKDGDLYCTSALGRLPAAIPRINPTVAFNGVEIYLQWPLLLSPTAKGIIVSYHGVSMVINPETANNLDAPPMFLSGLIYDRADQRVFHAYGHDEPLSPAETLAQGMVERDGVFYRPLCSKTYATCVVVSETRAAMMAGDRVHRAVYLTCGGLLGASFALILILFSSRQRTFERRLRRAIRKNKLSVAYQSVVDLETGAIVGAEALARWNSEADGSISPEVFVAVAENKGFVGEITRLVLSHVVEEMGDLLREEDFQVTINITTQDLSDPGFFAVLDRCLKAAGIMPSALGLELTERSTAEQTLVANAIAELKNAGHAVYIDDFGTGYSSLAYLHKLDAYAIKIDRTFTQTVGTEALTASVVPQILEIAAGLGLHVVVEGVETTEQAEYFRQAGRNIQAQGWYYGKAVPAAQFKRLLEATRFEQSHVVPVEIGPAAR